MRLITVVDNLVASFEVIIQEPPWISQGFGIYMEYTQMLVLGTIRYHIRTVITLRALKCHICWIQIENMPSSMTINHWTDNLVASFEVIIQEPPWM